MKVLSATYGDKDVTNIVRSKVTNGTLLVQASNSIFGDPNVGKVKTLTVNCDIGTYSVTENSFMRIPELKMSRLGIFYSNNNNDSIKPCILKSLERIKIASTGKADIITNVWHSLGSSNPFIETIAWTRTSSHLNQVLQILQCLYFAKSLHNYDYVSLLEHDVLYPEGYFDYDDFTEDCVCNMNYIGLCTTGFQSSTRPDKPLSQITMRFDYAIKHFESLLPNAILLNSGLLEPSNIGSWSCINPSVHVNHGKHFTSHYSIYSKTNIVENNEYWGSYEQYKELFI